MKYLPLFLLLSLGCITIERPIVVEPHRCECERSAIDKLVEGWDDADTGTYMPIILEPEPASEIYKCSFCNDWFQRPTGGFTSSTCAVYHTDGHCHYNDTPLEKRDE